MIGAFTLAGAHVDVDLDLAVILDGLLERRDVVAALVRVGTDGGQRVARLTWSVAELDAHLTATAEAYAAMAAGEAVVTEDLTDRQTVVDRAIADRLEATPAELADRLLAAVDQTVEGARGVDGAAAVPYYGMDVPLAVVAGMLLTELIVHGYDLARTHDQPFAVSDDAAYQALLTACSFTPIVLTPWARTRTMTYAYAPRGHRPITMELTAGPCQ